MHVKEHPDKTISTVCIIIMYVLPSSGVNRPRAPERPQNLRARKILSNGADGSLWHLDCGAWPHCVALHLAQPATKAHKNDIVSGRMSWFIAPSNSRLHEFFCIYEYVWNARRSIPCIMDNFIYLKCSDSYINCIDPFCKSYMDR